MSYTDRDICREYLEFLLSCDVDERTQADYELYCWTRGYDSFEEDMADVATPEDLDALRTMRLHAANILGRPVGVGRVETK